MRQLVFLACIASTACNCAGDDTRRTRTLEPSAADEASATPAAGPTTASEAGPVALTEDMATPWFRTGPAAEAAAAFRLERWQEAQRGFRAALAAARSDGERARLGLMLAFTSAELADWLAAAAGFERAAEALPQIADYLTYHAARAHYFARNTDRALALARAVPADSIVGADAELLAGDVLRAQGDAAAIAAHYGRYLAERPAGIRQAEARYRQAEALEAQGELEQAALLYDRVAVADPLTSWADKATERLAALTPKLPDETRAQVTTMTADELIERGMVYYDAMRNEKSEADFRAALGAPGLTDETRCIATYHLANSIYKQRNRKDSAPVFDDTITACKKVGNTDLQVKASYQSGRSHDYIGKHQIAADRYASVEGIDPSHTYNDDARLRQAEAYANLGNDAKVKELLSTIPDKYPEGDMRAEAVWRVGWKAYLDRDYREAIKWWQKQIETMPIDDNYWAEGQAQYWMGRAHAQLGETDASIASYEAAIRTYPLSYYALLALNRLREKHPERFAAMREEITRDPPGHDPDAPSFQFRPREAYTQPGFARAIEYLRLGLTWPVEAELRKLGLTPPSGKDRVEDPDVIEKLWAMAFLYHQAGAYEPSHWVTRWHILDYKRQWPVGANRARWEIAYPRAFWPLLDEHAKQHGFPTEMLMAIVREESAFDPLRESYANAIGLTQMIFPTARRFGKGTGIDITRENLRDPVKNVTIGSRFLAFLFDKWDDMYVLIPPSYNAGEGATARWLRARGEYPADAWIEAIRIDQARRYSKRVLSSFFAYSFIYGGKIPEMPNEIPDKLIPGR